MCQGPECVLPAIGYLAIGAVQGDSDRRHPRTHPRQLSRLHIHAREAAGCPLTARPAHHHGVRCQHWAGVHGNTPAPHRRRQRVHGVAIAVETRPVGQPDAFGNQQASRADIACQSTGQTTDQIESILLQSAKASQSGATPGNVRAGQYTSCRRVFNKRWRENRRACHCYTPAIARPAWQSTGRCRMSEIASRTRQPLLARAQRA